VRHIRMLGLVLGVVLVMAVAGCKGSSSGQDGTGSATDRTAAAGEAGSSGAADGAAASTAGHGPASEPRGVEPAPEGSGPESPRRPDPGDPVVYLPSMPTGGSPGSDTADQVDQCVQASWLDRRTLPPPGLGVSVASVSFDPTGLFDVGGPACSGHPPGCLEPSFAFTAENVASGDGSCYLPIHATGAGNEADSVTITFHGQLRCPPAKASVCAALVSAVGNSPAQVSAAVPPSPSPDPPSSDSQVPPSTPPPSTNPASTDPAPPGTASSSAQAATPAA
jgi:hypothetical protein